MIRNLNLLFGLLLTVAFVGLAHAQSAVPQVNVRGELRDTQGRPLQGEVALKVRLFEDVAGGDALFEVSYPNVSLGVTGVFSVSLEAQDDAAAVAAVLDGPSRYLELEVNGETLAPRLPFSTLPQVHRAARADTARLASQTEWVGALSEAMVAPADHHHDDSYLQQGEARRCPQGEVLREYSAAGPLGCSEDQDSVYSAGSGLVLSSDDQFRVHTITQRELGPEAVVPEKIHPGAINEAVLADGSVNSWVTAAGQITADKIKDESIDHRPLKGSGVTLYRMAAGCLDHGDGKLGLLTAEPSCQRRRCGGQYRICGSGSCNTPSSGPCNNTPVGWAVAP